MYDLSDYIKFLELRCMLARELMSPDGSFYIHTDTKVGHYVKVMLDGIFGRDNFRNDITRIKSNPKEFQQARLRQHQGHVTLLHQERQLYLERAASASIRGRDQSAVQQDRLARQTLHNDAIARAG